MRGESASVKVTVGAVLRFDANAELRIGGPLCVKKDRHVN